MTADILAQSRIFCIDDEPANLKLLNKMLTNGGYPAPVLIADPRQVLEHYRATRPELILLDINMPHLDGYQVMAQLQSLDDALLPPIVILTAQNDRESLLKALALGARDFITKPFDRTELMMRVGNLLQAQLAHRLVHDQKSVLEEIVRARTRELQDTRLQVVHRLGRAAEYRDEDTGDHILRMSHMSRLLAHTIGWTDADCDLMLHASPMHDVGKIGIPDAILLKPGKFEPAEWEIMKTHATIGANLLDGDDSSLMRMAHAIAIGHHEKWDGSGYPNGLVGAAIPQSARIVALADVFDALTSQRPYKKAWPIEDAVTLIKEGSGSQFDPALVEVFLARLPEILMIRQRFSFQSQG